MTAQVEQLNAPESLVSTEEQPDPALLWGAKQRVLLIDDDPIQLQIASATLGGHEYDVTTADDGWDGINTLKEHDFDLVVVDLDMPRLDGYGFIAEARKLEKCQHLPIMVVSGRQDVVSIDRAYDAGASSFMDKPVNWNLFGRQVRYVLRNAEAQNRLRDIGASARKDASLGEHLFQTVLEQSRTWLSEVDRGTEIFRDVLKGKLDPASLPDALRDLNGLEADARETLKMRQMDQAILCRARNLRDGSFDANQVWPDLAASLEQAAKKKSIELIISKTDAFATQINIDGDLELLQFALEKLIHNAINAAPENARIECASGDATRGSFTFEVIDSGAGFRQSDADSILHPKNHSWSLRSGTGLLVADKVARLHDGRLTFAEAKPGGTRAQIILPKSRIKRDES